MQIIDILALGSEQFGLKEGIMQMSDVSKGDKVDTSTFIARYTTNLHLRPIILE